MISSSLNIKEHDNPLADLSNFKNFYLHRKNVDFLQNILFVYFENIAQISRYLIERNNIYQLYELIYNINDELLLTTIKLNINNEKLKNHIVGSVSHIYTYLKANLIFNVKLELLYEILIAEYYNHTICSIILPVYNEEILIPRCIESVINQTFMHWELICVDDGSTDRSGIIADQYAKIDKRIKVFHKDNGGQSSARNLALKYINGKFTAFIDADDWFEPSFIFEMVYSMSHDIDIVSCGANIIFDNDYDNKFVKNRMQKIYGCKKSYTADVNQNTLLKTNTTLWNKLLKSEIIINNKILFSEGLIFEDNEFIFKYMYYSKNIHYLGMNLYNYYQDNNSTMTNIRGIKSNKTLDFIRIYNNIYSFYASKNNSLDYKDFLTKKYHDFMGMAYSLSPDYKKPKVIEKVVEISNNYDYKLIVGPILEYVKNNIINKVRSLNHLIVSLTSHPGRIEYVHKVIDSIFKQKLKPDMLILYLAVEQFPKKENSLPENLLKCVDSGLHIRWWHDIKSYKKIIPPLIEFSNSVIVTADDDIIYPTYWLEKLYKKYEENDKCIIAHITRKILLDNNNYKPYYKWPVGSYGHGASYLNMGIGVGGALYKKSLLINDVINEELFMKLARTTDDIWLWSMGVLNGTKTISLNSKLDEFRMIEGTQEEALWQANRKGLNDESIRNIIKQYPELQYPAQFN